MTTNQVGKITELKILLRITELGYSVSLPYGEKEKYDQLWDINGKIIKVQVKTARPIDEQNSGIKFNCYSVSNGHKHVYTKQDIDYFATLWNETIYLIPVEECSTEKSLRFFTTSKCTNLKQINWAQDYIVEEVLKKID